MAELSPQEKDPRTELLSLSKMFISSVMDDQRPPAFMNSDWIISSVFRIRSRIFFQSWNRQPRLRWSQNTPLSPNVNQAMVVAD